jgi:hypothetical protein
VNPRESSPYDSISRQDSVFVEKNAVNGVFQRHDGGA